MWRHNGTLPGTIRHQSTRNPVELVNWRKLSEARGALRPTDRDVVDIALRRAAKQWLFRVLCGNRGDRLIQICTCPATANEANVAEVAAAIRLHSLDFHLVIRR